MRHRELARDIVILFGGAFVGFETNLAVRKAEGTILASGSVGWAIGGLLATAGAAFWLNYREERSLTRPTWVGRGTPFPGLQPFTEHRAGVFFGREQEINELASRLIGAGRSTDTRFIVLVGASGGGKSSLLRAGLKPRLAGTGDWAVMGPINPGSQGLDVLADVLAHAAPSIVTTEERARFARDLRRASGLSTGTRPNGHNPVLSKRLREVRHGRAPYRLLLLDQFEEIVTLASPNERDGFIAHVIQMLDEDPDLRVVAALRSEFLTELLTGSAARLLRDPYVLPGMDEAGLRAAIVEPARHAGITLEEGVVDEMLRDAKGGDALPLLAYLLRELCPGEPAGSSVTRAAYRAAGGVAAALRRQADATLRRLGDRYDADAVIETLLRFVTLEGAEPTRRCVTTTELTPAQQDIVAEFIEARLLVSAGDTVDLTHETTLRQWEPLRLAISRQEEVLRRRTNIEPHAREWDRAGRRDDFLLQGERLREVRTWLADPAFGSTPVVQDFVAASAVRAESLAQDTANVVTGHALRLMATYPELAAALAHAAVAECSPTPYALYGLSRALDAPLRRIRHRGAALIGLDRSTTGDLVAISADEEILVWRDSNDATTVGHPGGERPRSAAWSSEGVLASGMDDGTVRVWAKDLQTSRRLIGCDEAIVGVAWSPDGRLSCLSSSGATRTWQPDFRTWEDEKRNLAKGQVLAWSVTGLLAVGYSDGSVRIDAPNADTIRVPTRGGRVMSLAWSADERLAVGSTDGLVRVLDARGAECLRLSGHGGRALSVAWSPEGTLASGSDNGEIHVWQSEREKPTVLCGHQGPVRALRWSDAFGLLSVGEDGAVLEWSTEANDGVLLATESNRVLGVAWSPHNELAHTSNDRIKIWSADGARCQVLDSGDSEVWAIGWSSTGSLVAGSANGTVRVWLTPKEEPVCWQAHEAGIWSVACSPDGRLATGSNDGTVRVWRTPAGEPQVYPIGEVEVWTVSWSTNGWLAAGAEDGRVRVWRPGIAEPTILTTGDSPVWIVAWSSDGRLAASSGDGIVRVWEPDLSSDPILLEGHGKGAWSVAWSPDGRLAAGAGDGTIRVWRPGVNSGPVDVAAHRDGVWLVAWSPDGRLASSSEDNSVRIMNLPVSGAEHLLALYEDRGFRMLTPDERRRFHLPVASEVPERDPMV